MMRSGSVASPPSNPASFWRQTARRPPASLQASCGLRSSAALLVSSATGDQVPAVGLAKQEEEIFIPERAQPLQLPRASEGLYLMQRIRDEAHRFAITYHRTLRRKQTVISQLDGVPGIGPKRRSALLKHFGSIEAIRNASVEELSAVPSMTRKAAEQLKGSL